MSSIRSYRDVFVPRFFLEVDGKRADDLLPYVTRFEFTDHEKKADVLELDFDNRGLRFQDNYRFYKGVRVRVRWGYAHDVSDVRQMIVTGVSHEVSPTRQPLLRMVAYDIRRVLNKGGKPKNWGAISSSAVAAQIAARYGLVTSIVDSGDSRKEARIQPADSTDMEYLVSLAEKLNWDCYIEGSRLHFHPKRFNDAPAMEFTYYTDSLGTLLDFNSELNLKKKPSTGMAGVSPTSGESSAASADATSTGAECAAGYSVDISTDLGALVGSPQLFPNDDAYSVGAQARQAEISPLLCPTPETNASVISKHAKAKQAAIELTAVKATATMIGTPRLRARTMVRILGVGVAYSGKWRVKQATHSISPSGSVYQTSVQLVRNALSKGTNSVNGRDQPVGPQYDPKEPVTVYNDVGGISFRS